MSTSHSRLHRAFARHGIALEREGAAIRVRRNDTDATILLPAELPLEAKAVAQLLDFAAVGWPDRPRPVRCACATIDGRCVVPRHRLGHPAWLQSCSHDAGRAIRRQVVRRHALQADRTDAPAWRCITLREDRRLEEDPSAYKPIGPVLRSQEEAGLLRAAVRLRPWRTFKA